MDTRIYQLYLELLARHGPPVKFWPQWCAGKKSERDRGTIVLGAILTQRTNWHNADLALRNLKKEKWLSLKKIAALNDLGKLVSLIKPAGFYNTKSRRIFDFCLFIAEEYGGLKNFMKTDLKTARRQLLSLYGIGPETADVILLYALDKPSFVVDEYTRRLVRKNNLATNLNYDFLKNFFEKNLPADVSIFQNFHAFIIIEQKGKPGSLMAKI
ncbi:endonuclease [Candidatus Shapirobacteria bacterium CG09_land_8_20_14_0_10_47_13]|uniref:Endonuclease n=1 Tax=Candidatus Shapirobacteria bacterium CG09_land_8_20_14_0_10_47_13 TaxID=1974481 RepID=A0A2H0WNM3_9BACT|nr:MAG: endonuclease [Candidatus Shapirobacteria bacterium CG09_land_8_20_14_0_10_47_13]